MPRFTHPTLSSAVQTRLFTAVTALVTVLGLIVSAMRPPALVDALEGAVASAGPGAPVAFVVLCAVLAPLHLSGVLVVMSLLFWPLPLAATLSVVGVLIGSVLTIVLLSRVGVSTRSRDGWPGWMQRLSTHVERRPLVVGFAARLMMNTGIALEAFYLLTGYTRRTYLLVTLAGTVAWVVQALIGVRAMTALLEISAWYGAALLVAPLIPLLLMAAVAAWRRRAPTG